MFHWTGYLVAEVAGYLKQGLSAEEIASQIGTSRQAVTGKVARDETLKKIGFSLKRVKTATAWQETIKAGAFHVVGKTMAMLQPRDCRWAVNDADVGEQHLFCSITSEEGKHYCTHHLSVLYQPRRDR